MFLQPHQVCLRLHSCPDVTSCSVLGPPLALHHGVINTAQRASRQSITGRRLGGNLMVKPSGNPVLVGDSTAVLTLTLTYISVFSHANSLAVLLLLCSRLLVQVFVVVAASVSVFHSS